MQRPRPSLVSEVSHQPALVTPAVWRYHPPQPARVNAELTLPSGDLVLAGRRGERWLISKGGDALQAASALAPEDLVGILPARGGGLVFVGASGVSYEAPQPIAAFSRSSAPLEPLASVTSSRSAIVGIRRDRGLLRSDDGGTTWSAVAQGGPQFVSVALARDGTGLALAVPEALYRTRDDGRTFSRVDVPSVGAFAFERLPDGELGVVSALGLFRYREAPQPLLEAAQSGADERVPMPRGLRGPDASALNEGRAAMTAGEYFELSPGDKAGQWLLTAGPLAGAFGSRVVAELAGCRAVRLAAFERELSAACFRAGADSATQPIELWSSHDAGATFSADGPPVDGNLITFRSALGAEGTLLLSGICPSHAKGSGCAPRGIARRTRVASARADGKADGVRYDTSAAATPSLVDTALALTFSMNGRIAYAVGRRTKGGVLAMFVSRDGGRSFEAGDLALPTDDEGDGEERWENSAAGVRIDALVAAEDGSVGLAVSRYRARVWAVLDESGRALSISKPPEPGALLGVAGSRALVVSPASNEVWESLDAGATFRSVGKLPIDLCSGDAACEVQLACTPYGCAVGSDVSRLGWGGREDDDGWLLAAPGPSPVDYSVPRLKTPLGCQLDPAPWQTLEGVTEFPSAFQAAIGRAAWFASGRDPARASVWVWVATAGAQPRIARETLLPPSERGRSFALMASDQVEGVAALRYLAPDADAASSRLTNVEIGWLNLLEGRTRRASLADGGAYAPGDFARSPRGTQEAEPALLSIAEGGIYLRIHRAAGDNQPTLFFDGKGQEKIPPVAWPVVGVRGTHSEMAHIDGEHVPLLLVGRGSAVLRARFVAGQQQLDAFAVGALSPASFGLTQSSNIAYAGARAGQVIETFDSASARASARLFAFRARGPVLEAPIEVPTQLSLPERPERCSAEVEAATPRIVAAHYPGTRHPVIVSDGGDAPQTFLTSYAVLHGTPGSPCVSSFDAEPIVGDGAVAPVMRLILPYADLTRSHAFRASAEGGVVRVEHRGMSCKLDPSLEVPQELYRAPGALVPRVR